jgi:DNA polymerase I-like protein with 3'-5' exonuclease and polymerase domains
MDFSQLSDILVNATNKNVYLRTIPDVWDFTDNSFLPILCIYIGNEKIQLAFANENLHLLIELLKLSIFSKGSKIICWDWKSLSSFITFKTSKLFHIDAAIIDLKILESYSSIKNKNAPESLIEAFERLKVVMKNWKEIENIYKNLHVPLMTSVLPHLETTGILSKLSESKVYAHYEIDGQENGRLRCSGVFSKNYVPHAMTPELRENLKPRTEDELFMLFDYKGMEVFMLAWLSDDPVLKELCSYPDVYSAIHEKIMNKKAGGVEDRELAKKYFLPVMYGQTANGLSNRCGVAIDVAEYIVEKINKEFSVASAFIVGHIKQLQNYGYAKDFFGKRRFFEKGKEYSVRNFSVQSPSAVVCSEKLIHLYSALKNISDIAYTVHDGYVVYATKENWKQVFKIGSEVLGGESTFCPGLRLRVTCRAGRNLNDLKSLERKG